MGRVPLRPPVLDVGTGDGHFASATYETPIDVGIDVRWRDLKRAAGRPGAYRSVVRANATALPFRDGTFNTVLSNCVIEHVPNLEATLQEIHRVLAPGGAFATTLPSEHFADFLLGSTLLRALRLRGPARAYGQFLNSISKHHHVYPPRVWRVHLERAGFRVVEHHYYFSPRAHRVFDLCHYLGLPNLITRVLTGRWVLHPAQMWAFDRWLRAYYEETLAEVGAYQFIRCQRDDEGARNTQKSFPSTLDA